GCPNCGGPITAERLEKGLPCERCLPNPVKGGVGEVYRALRENGVTGRYSLLWIQEREYERFREFFEKANGSSLWSAQTSWAKRLLNGQSFAIIAPTGVGKSTLLMTYAVYKASGGEGRVLYILPTENLVIQVAGKLAEIARNSGEEVSIVYYYGSMSKKKREEALSRIAAGDYDILVITTGFLQRRYELLSEESFDYIIIDDVDSLLRNSKNIDRVLVLLGFPPESVEIAYKLVKTRLKFFAELKNSRESIIEELKTKVIGLEKTLGESVKDRLIGQLVIATATGRPRGFKHFLFKELLGFEVGGGSDYMRDIVDSYIVTGNIYEDLAKVVRELGPGGLVFVSQIHGKGEAVKIVEYLKETGMRVEQALTGSSKAVRRFSEGKADLIVGMASRYGVIVRGLDLPEKVRYTVFIGVPGRRISIDNAVKNPQRLISLLSGIQDRGDAKAGQAAEKISLLLEKVGSYELVQMALQGKISPTGLVEMLVNLIREWGSYVIAAYDSLVDEGRSIRVSSYVLVKRNGRLYIDVPDIPTYLQASGRASRLYKMVMTKGLSVIIDPVKERIDAFSDRLKFYVFENKLEPYDKLNKKELLKEMGLSRKGIGKKVDIETLLFIVESPNKARTIAWFWGRPARRRYGRLTVYETSVMDPDTGRAYLVTITSTLGHLYDLVVDDKESFHGVRWSPEWGFMPVYGTIKKCLTCGHRFASTENRCPICGETEAIVDSSTRLNVLTKLAREVDKIVIATDPDTEGEKIAYDVYLTLRPYNANIWRGEFHEVTPMAIIEAIRNPRRIDMKLVKAQIYRRIEDRWIGFSVSRRLWERFGKKWFGAGRVQTPVLGWVIERYKEWKRNLGYGVTVKLSNGGKVVFYMNDKALAREIRKKGIDRVVVTDKKIVETSRNPPPPYSTDSLLYDASRKLGFNSETTMSLAQNLFEAGLITYHRTDSTRVSSTGIRVALEYLRKKGMEPIASPRSWGEGGAHEAIRPTQPLDAEEVKRRIIDGSLRVQIKITSWHLKLYDLIFRRFVASQMKPAKLLLGEARVTAPYNLETVLKGVVGVIEHGYDLIDQPVSLEWIVNIEPGEKIKVEECFVYRSSTVSLYKSGDLIKLMKEKGIGRPSTYASAIYANKRHGYIIESRKKKFVIPTRQGMETYDYVMESFSQLLSEEASRVMESVMDLIYNEAIDIDDALTTLKAQVEELVSGSITRGELGETIGSA
ncbi:MAG: reverse gyrase, partial [Desulfurococcales archaeon]|nr:reverse gyrase [Desulfurococcales archaeon]